MDDQDYNELRMRLMAHNVLLCAMLATHSDKNQFATTMTQVLDQIQSQLLSSKLDDKTLGIFDAEIRAILNKAGIAMAGG